jgi:hypothetical protein
MPGWSVNEEFRGSDVNLENHTSAADCADSRGKGKGIRVIRANPLRKVLIFVLQV